MTILNTLLDKKWGHSRSLKIGTMITCNYTCNYAIYKAICPLTNAKRLLNQKQVIKFRQTLHCSILNNIQGYNNKMEMLASGCL